LNANQPAKLRLENLQPISKTTTEPVGREALATNQRTINRTGGALQPLSEASTGCGNGLQLISDASTALAEIAGILPFRAVCQRFLSRFRPDSSFSFHHIFLLTVGRSVN
jgi:hypothetical protein